MRLFKKQSRTKGQALVEFAIIAAALLMIIFLIIEAARILWAWGTVQNAARAGARYAITGGFERDCSTQDIPKYSDLCADIDLRRPASVINKAHQNLAGLPLNEDVTSVFEDNEYYSIEVFGVDVLGQLKGSFLPAPYGPEPFAGAPNRPVIVRVTYRVPIITPFFSPILSSIPVFGQTTLYNEAFGQLGGTGQSAGAPPPVPPLPTPGVTPSPTPTSTPGATPSSTPTPESTIPNTPVPCPIRWTSSLVADVGAASVTGLYYNESDGSNYTVNFYNYTLDPGLISPIGTATMLEDTGNVHACPGIGNAILPITSANTGHTIRVVHPDGTFADIIVQGGTDTPTPTATNTGIPTAAITPTSAATATPTPRGPFISVLPSSCALAPTTEIFVSGVNWPDDEDIFIYVNGRLREQILSTTHHGTFTKQWVEAIDDGDTYQVLAVASGGAEDSHTFVVPCADITPTPVTSTPTNTPIPADLIIGNPVMISTPPIVEYLPVQFQVPITNDGEVDVNSQFFVDIFIDPPTIYPDHIPIPPHPAYSAVGSLSGGSSKVITITSELGFTGGATDRSVYSMVDSLQDVIESSETNNISEVLNVVVTPADPPEPTPTPDGFDTISGRVRFLISSWIPQQRAQVYLINNTTVETVSSAITNESGYFEFNNISDNADGYRAVACFAIEGVVYVGSIPVVHPPNSFASIFMTSPEAACPVNN
ncbi:MAG: hypothetical protein CSA11_04900 [Chloroflexi bacterium]|nr:MAG: hypothetical protein CSA11_04900 [Chloroflexota bacterium]